MSGQGLVFALILAAAALIVLSAWRGTDLPREVPSGGLTILGVLIVIWFARGVYGQWRKQWASR